MYILFNGLSKQRSHLFHFFVNPIEKHSQQIYKYREKT